MRPAFILGSARCGSTLVSSILRLHPDILSLSELFSTAGAFAFPQGRISAARFWRGLSRPTRTGSLVGNPERAPREFLYGRQEGNRFDPFRCPPILSVTLPHLSQAPDELFDYLEKQALLQPKQEAAQHYRALFGALAERLGKSVPVERSGGSLVAVRTLRRMFPEARYVLLTRAGPETVLSMCDYPATRLAVAMWQRLRAPGIDLLSPDSHYGTGRIWPILQSLSAALPLRRILDTPPDPLEVAHFWSAMTLRGAEALRDLPPAARMHLSYEALVNDPRAGITRLGQFLAGSSPEPWLDAASRLPRLRPPRSESLTPDLRAALIRACAPGEAALQALLAGWERSSPPGQTGF